MSALACPSCGTPDRGSRFCGACGLDLLTPSAGVATITDPAPPSTLAACTVVGGRYFVHGVIATGSMGVIYAAADTRDQGTLRALKELLPAWASVDEQAEAVAWFWREAMIQAGLQHPAIPQVHDTFSEGVRHYLVMDLVEGRSLEQVLAEEGTPGLPEARVVPWAEQVLDVLSYLHSRADPLIFRDLKPANLMLTPAGQVRLIDFGIARVFTRQAQGTAIGTPGYAPPEQYQGLAEPASDLYALGATLHHLLTGRDPRTHRPFDFPPVRSLAPDAGVPVAAAIDRALALDPRARPGTAAEMRKALRATTQETMPRLTMSGSLARGNSGTMPGLSSRAAVPVVVDPSSGGVVKVGPRAVRLRPQEVQIAFSGNRVVTHLDHRTLRLRNRTNQKLLCTFDANVPWLRPDRPADWLEPGGKLELSLSVNWPNPPTGLHMGEIAVHAGNQTWSTPVRLRVRQTVRRPVARGAFEPLSRVAALCFVVGALANLLGVLGMHVMAAQAAWELLVAGLVGRLVFGVMGAGKGP